MASLENSLPAGPTSQPTSAEALLATLPWGVLMVDAQGLLQYSNPPAARWGTAAPDAWLGQPLASLGLPAELTTALHQPVGAATHEAWLPASGQWVSFAAVPQPAGGWVVYGQDITIQKQREQQYQVLADNTPDLLTRWTPDLRLCYANSAVADAIGHPVPALLGGTGNELGLPEVLASPYLAALQRVFDTGQPQELSYPLPTPQGARLYHARLVPELRNGQIETVLGIARDLTELQQAEALRLRDELIRQPTDKDHPLFHRTDITERQQAEQRQHFLLQLSDALRPLTDPLAMQQAATQLLAAHFQVLRASYTEVEPDGDIFTLTACCEQAGAVPLPTRLHLSDFAPAMAAAYRAGRPLVFNDTETDTQFGSEPAAYRPLGIRAWLAVPLVKNGCLLMVVSLHSATPRAWTAADEQLLEDVAERTWAAVERARAEDALAASEEKYRTLFNSTNEGFALQELVYDGDGQIEDIIFREVNQAYERQSGLVNVVGKSSKEVLPQLEQHWKDVYAQVAKTGEPMRVANYAQDVDRWFDTYLALLAGSNKYVAVVFNDITERKRREAGQTLLGKVSEDLTQLTNLDATLNGLCAKIGGYFGASTCAFSPVDETAGTIAFQYEWHQADAISPTGVYRLTDYYSSEVLLRMRAGQPEVVPDTAALPAPAAANLTARRTGALVNLPLVRAGRWWGTLSLTLSAPHEWRADELELLCELAARIWTRLECARAEEALRASEEKYAALFAASPVPFMMLAPNAPDFTISTANEAYFAATLTAPASLIGRRLFDVFPDDPARPGQLGSDVLKISLDRVLATRQPDAMARTRYDLALPDGGYAPHWWLAINAPVLDAAGQVSTIIHQVTRVTELHLAEEAERVQQEGQVFLLRLSDALRAERSPDAVATVATRLLAHYLQVDRCHIVQLSPARQLGWIGPEYHAPDLPDLAGKYRFADFPESMRRLETEPLIVHDLWHDASLSAADQQSIAAMGMQAVLTCALRQGERYCGWALNVGTRTPRAWSEYDRLLVKEVAERTWTAGERVRAEAALRASEAQLRSFVQASSNALYRMTADWRQMLNLDGKGSLADTTERSANWLEAYILPADQAAVAAAIRAAIESPRFFELEHRVLRADGSVGWMASRAVPVFSAHGELVEWFGTASDISARKQAEEALRISEAKYRTLFESVDQGFGLAEVLAPDDPASPAADFRWLDVNSQFERLTGLARTDLLSGRTARQLLPNLKPFWFAHYGQVAATGEPVHFEEYEPAIDSWFDVYAFAVGAPAARCIAMLFTNTTERKRAEEASRQAEAQYRRQLEQQVAERTQQLQENRDLLQSIFDTSMAAIGVFQAVRGTDGTVEDFRFTLVNHEQERVMGRSDLVGQYHSQLYPGVRQTNVWEAMLRTLSTGEAQKGESYYPSKEVDRWFVTMFTKLGDGVVAASFDVTDRKQAAIDAQRLRQQQLAAVLEGQEEERRRIAESLHNGIGQVLFATKLRLDGLPCRPQEPSWVEAKELLLDAIKQTRAVSHELTPAVLTDFGLQEALETICQQLTSPSLRWHCYIDLAEASALPVALQQAVYRLVQGLAHNVARHAQAHEASIEVTALPGWLVLHIDDDGRGFDPATVTEGLGLQTLRSRVAVLGGTVQVDSAPGQGTQIRAHLPLPG